MCGAFATSAPAASNSAQEKSSRSRMFTELAVCCSTAPICSATCMHTPAMISRRCGSGRPSIAAGSRVATEDVVAVSSRTSRRLRSGSSSQFQPGAIQCVAPGSTISSGPARRSPGASAARVSRSTSVNGQSPVPPGHARTRCAAKCVSSDDCPAARVASATGAASGSLAGSWACSFARSTASTSRAAITTSVSCVGATPNNRR